ncbi:MAG: CPBP family intramembrane metalloprotease [Defluviitaleaceae bacterium]|nr:CPBP family intramembrane metalloprotease [Defluviitaleaceae bacterium]
MNQDNISPENKSVGLRPNVIMFFFFVFIVIYPSFLYGWLYDQGTLHSLVLHAVYVVELMSIPVILYLVISRKRPKNVLSIAPITLKNAMYVAGITIAFVPITWILIWGGMFLGDSLPVYIPSFNTMWLGILTGGIIVAIFEELFFRGPVAYEYKRFGISIWKVALMSGVFFGALHGGVIQISYTAVWGFAMVLMLYYTRSIFAPILSHVIGNIFGHLLNPSYFVNSYMELGDMFPNLLVIAGAATVVLLPIMVICWKKLIINNPQGKESPAKESKRFVYSYWAVIVIIVVMTVLREINT